MMYNAAGQILRPLVVHKADIPKAVSDYMEKDFNFVQTQKGELNADVLMDIKQEIAR